MPCLPLDDEELAVVVKSLSITSDALIHKIDRLDEGRRRREAVGEYHVVDRVITRAREMQTKRVS